MTNSRLQDKQTSASVYTQITDVELECDGFLNCKKNKKKNMDLDALVTRISNPTHPTPNPHYAQTPSTPAPRIAHSLALPCRRTLSLADDRSNKFNAADTARIAAANKAIIDGAALSTALPSDP